MVWSDSEDVGATFGRLRAREARPYDGTAMGWCSVESRPGRDPGTCVSANRKTIGSTGFEERGVQHPTRQKALLPRLPDESNSVSYRCKKPEISI